LHLKNPDSIFFILFLFSIFGNTLLNTGIALAASPSATTSVNITKSISSENLAKSASIVVLLKISKQANMLVKDVIITDVVPSMLIGEPKELFKNNVLQKRLTLLDNNDFFSYSVSPKNDFELSKNWSFVMPSAQVMYKVGNDTQIKSSNSNSPNLKLVSEKKTISDWKIDYWPVYVIVLFSIAIASGAAGGAINYKLKYRSASRSIVSNKQFIKSSYVLEVEYANYIEIDDTCNIKVTSYSMVTPSTAPQIRCEIIIKGQVESTFPISIGTDEKHKEVKEESYVIKDKNAQLKIKDGTSEEIITINVTGRSLGRDVGAGAAAGLITLLALVTTTTAVSGNATWVSLNTYPQNVQSMVTLFVTCFIAGLVPFQILDRSTGQLVDTIKITKEQAKKDAIIADKAEKEVKRIALFASQELDSINKLLLTKPSPTVLEVQEAQMRAELLKKHLAP
jgi:hypothetical protein